jgi:uncharacterized protein DUF4832/glycosyl hydrolase family 42 (putative beta-galactosidase)
VQLQTRPSRPVIAASMLGALLMAPPMLSAQTTVVRPTEIDDVLVNPGMGIETFQRFQGQSLNEGVRWSEVGPEVAGADASTPHVDFPASSVAYLRWFWSQIEPQHGTYHWSIIDDALAEARRHGQRLAIRIMPYDDKHPMPDWYIKSGAKRANAPTDKDGAIWSPDANDPLYSKYWSALIVEAGKRYDGHPELNHVDVSTVGYWGEGWGPYLPEWSVQQELIDLYFKAFPRTLLLMNFDALPALQYGVKLGGGWRLDCWGDMGAPGRSFAHMKDLYPQQIARGGLQDVWQTRPVALETCWVPEQWHQWNFPLKPILDQALRWHASTINIKSSRIPADWKTAFDEFQKQIGYRFVLKKLDYPSHVAPGSMAPVNMWWFNAGVAPVYRSYTLALAIGDTVIALDTDVRRWLPGDAVYENTIAVPRELAPGRYRLRVALLDPATRRPAIQLAITGRQADGWYQVGEIVVE